jgi:hypothetical protein
MPLIPPDLLYQIKRFFADPVQAFGTIFAVLGYGGWKLVQLIVKDPTKTFLKKAASIPPTPLPHPLPHVIVQAPNPFGAEVLTGRLQALELEQAKIRMERNAWEKAEKDDVEAELTNVSTQLFAARQNLTEMASRHQRELAERDAENIKALHTIEARWEAADRVHLRKIAELEAQVAGLKARLAFHDSQLEMKIERISVALEQPEERVALRRDGHDTDRSPPPPLPNGPRRRPGK